jgi:SAM-dependent methyltransferase
VTSPTDELRDAHDVLAAYYREHLPGLLEQMPIERAVLDLFCEMTLAAGIGADVGDLGCGTGRITPYLAGRGLTPRGVDLSPEMVRVAREDFPDFGFEIGDLRALPFGDGALAGAVCWYSLLFLAPEDRPVAFGEFARVVKPGGYFVTAYKTGDGNLLRTGGATTLGVNFDRYHLSSDEMERRATEAGFETVFWGGRPPEDTEQTPQGYLLCRRR